MEPQKAPDSQNHPEQKEQCWKDYQSKSQDLLQGYSDKNNPVTAQKQTPD